MKKTKWNLHKKISRIPFLIVFLSLPFLFSCEPDDTILVFGDDDEFIITGVSATGAPIANALVELRTEEGQIFNGTTNDLGEYVIQNIKSDQPFSFILRITHSDEFIYSLGYASSENPSVEFTINGSETNVSEDITVIRANIHPFTDLISRNQFAQNSQDIDLSFDSNSAIDIPDVNQREEIASEIKNIISPTLNQFIESANFNFFTSEFNADSTGFDLFLDNSFVSTDEDSILIQVIDPNENISTTLVDNLALQNDFLSVNDNAPSQPQDVRNLIGQIDNIFGEIVVSWTASIDDIGVAEYNIYRNGDFIGTTPYTSFRDENLTLGTTFFYQIEAVDNRGQVSIRSETSISILLEEPDIDPPPTPVNLIAIIENGFVQLSWQQDSIEEVHGFRVIRDDTNEIAQVTDTLYQDRNLTLGQTACYRVISFDGADNESPASEEECITFGENLPSSVEFSSSTFSTSESSGMTEITVQRIGNLSETISVEYSTQANTASESDDYTPTSGTLQWEQNNGSPMSFLVQITSDDLDEPDESISLLLNNPVNTLLGTQVISVLSIIDDDEPIECTDIDDGNIATDTEFSDPCYNINSNITISEGANLTIGPGVQLNFADDTELMILSDGTLTAAGSVDNPIIFTAVSRLPGSWRGINIQSSSDSVLDHTVVEFGGLISDDTSATIQISGNGSARITNSVIQNSAARGITKTATANLAAFANNTITANRSSPILIDANSLGQLDTLSSYTGNANDLDEMQDFIAITASVVSDNQTWQNLGVDYHFIDSEDYGLTGDLVISAGTTMRFALDSRLRVSSTGQIQAIGTETERITFSSILDGPGSWISIMFQNSTRDNIFDFVIVENGGGGGDAANLRLAGAARLRLSNAMLINSSVYGLNVNSPQANLTMENTEITQNGFSVFANSNNLGVLTINNSYSGNLRADKVVVAGTSIDSDQTFNNIGISYEIPLFMEINAAVTIEAGNTVIFSETPSGFLVNSTGSLSVLGAIDNRVLLTNQVESRIWDGIQYSSSNSPNNIIQFTDIEFGGNAAGVTQALVGFINSGSGPSSGNITNTKL